MSRASTPSAAKMPTASPLASQQKYARAKADGFYDKELCR